jgi:ABC-type uncharacterized transport system involved in gliding motility auxiliary subunit
VVVFGNSVFATDQAFDAYGNGNMFINSVDWAAEQENLINITPREQTQRSLKPIENWKFIFMIISYWYCPLLSLQVFPRFARRKRGQENGS